LKLESGREKEGSMLTGREREVLQLIASGLTNKKIADKLSISVKTVETHRTRILQKLDVHTTADLVRYAIKTGLLDV
jgi:DNA-binding NarL/FixJ family response regulator